jgi:hypothetical protein
MFISISAYFPTAGARLYLYNCHMTPPYGNQYQVLLANRLSTSYNCSRSDVHYVRQLEQQGIYVLPDLNRHRSRSQLSSTRYDRAGSSWEMMTSQPQLHSSYSSKLCVMNYVLAVHKSPSATS